ncbi:MbcA/ParS/Xre antitoxin family protein [Aromatoleum toluclasticum]|uniref:MbcA/ParS/Xre antitoxin family protein n=1 Tax=Aromatoleum toluclasticum TaxID=92003 RepID=UPI001D1962A2|nr:MbcA/ParS/Xre antitoxin family protein [Aromatoleum toluclasticum]MCC4118449.1 MbcA/ParS/Xre antitoxin family protein [Aromatoleum toluclasticum]
MQIEEVEKLAETVFGDRARASEWLRTSNESLGGCAPLSRLDTEDGRREVARILNAIGYGGAA